MEPVESVDKETTKARFIRTLNGTLLYGTFRLVNELRTITDEETAFKIVTALRAKMQAIQTRYGDLAAPGFRFMVPKKEFDYKRLRIELVYRENVVLDTLTLAFVKDPESYHDVKAVLESDITTWTGDAWVTLQAYLIQPRIKSVLKRLEHSKQAAIEDAFKKYQACFKEPPQTHLPFRFTLVPEYLHFEAGSGYWLQCTVEL